MSNNFHYYRKFNVVYGPDKILVTSGGGAKDLKY